MRHSIAMLSTVAVAALALTACSPGSSSDDSSGESSTGGGKTTVTFRLWDDQAAKAYEESFAAFEESHPDIHVEIQQVAWDDYWKNLPLDVSSGNMADIYWVNSSGYGAYADNGNLVEIGSDFDDLKSDWVQSITDIYTRDGKVWGVPQLWDSIALYYNKTLVDAAGIDPATLAWDPSGANDTFLPAAQALTIDASGVKANEAGFDPNSVAQWGFNASADLQAIYVDFIGSNGGTWQDGDEWALTGDKDTEAIQYLVDLINTQHVSPSAADTNTNGDFTRDQFIAGKMALFQSGPYNLKNIADGADFEWGIAPMLEGPAGRVPVVHGVAAVGNAKSKNPDAVTEVLQWLGSADGQAAIAEQGVAFPGVKSAQQAFVDYWTEQGVDVQPFIDATEGDTIPAVVGPNANAGVGALSPIMQEIFIGRTPVADGLKEAQDAANAAIQE